MKKKFKTIVVVDDEPTVFYTVQNGLEAYGGEYRVIDIDSGEKCLELLENNQIPDINLLEFMSPEMSSWEMHNKIKDVLLCRGMSIIFLTKRTDQIAKNAGEFLSNDYFGKPFEIRDLKRKIDRNLKP